MELSGICPLTTHDALRRAAAIAGDLEAVVTPSQRITYAQLQREVAGIGAALHAAGVGKGERVAICLGNGPRWVALFLALGSAGAITIPINTRFQADEFGYVLRQSRARRVFIADRFLSVDFIEMLRRCCPAVDSALPDPSCPDLRQVVVIGEAVPPAAVAWDAFMAGASEFTEPSPTPDDTLLVQYTSGTTARPKGVLLTHRGMCADAFFSGWRMGLRSGDRFFSPRPFFHVAGSTLSILASIQQASTLVTMERFQPAQALELMEGERCTHFSGNDTIALMLLAEQQRQRRALPLRGGWLAASAAIIERVIDEMGATECVAGYGLSEASPNVAQSACWESREVRAAGLMQPQPGVQVRIRDQVSGSDSQPGQSGEIQVRGWNVMQGYLDQPDETAKVLSEDGWLSTGDLGRLDSAGRLEFIGRLKEIIRVGGENVAPAEIEDALHRHPRIRQAAVVGVPDERLMEVPFAFVLLSEEGAAASDDITAWARQHLASFKVPRYVHFVRDFESLGMTASSKVQRGSLSEYAKTLVRK